MKPDGLQLRGQVTSTRARRRTNVTALNGAVACELSTSNYGKGEWWMLVRKS